MRETQREVIRTDMKSYGQEEYDSANGKMG